VNYKICVWLLFFFVTVAFTSHIQASNLEPASALCLLICPIL